MYTSLQLPEPAAVLIGLSWRRDVQGQKAELEVESVAAGAAMNLNSRPWTLVHLVTSTPFVCRPVKSSFSCIFTNIPLMCT